MRVHSREGSLTVSNRRYAELQVLDGRLLDSRR
jgi:hypothetical protein